MKHNNTFPPQADRRASAGTITSPSTVYTSTTAEARAVRQKVLDRMVDHFGRLLRMKPADGLRWTSTLTDLMETVHIVWATGRITAPDGRPMTFADMVRLACAILHCRVPRNPSALAARGAQRKSVRTCPVMRHYIEMVVGARLVNPFQMDVTD